MSETFSLRIISCDYYQEKPIRGLDETYSKFRSAEIESVPVIRIFGITPAGQKACLHVHGVYPYLSVPYNGQMGDTLSQYLQELASNIDSSINSVGFKGKKQHVYKIEVKKAIPYYGYNETEQTYLKVLLYSPSVIKKLIELLNGGMIMNTWQQPHEAHIPYILQFFIDYNLFGMNYIHVANIRFRIFPTELNFQPLTSPLIDERHIHEDGLWNFANLPPNMCLGENVKRQSTCELEVDCSSGFILNRLDSTATSGSNPGLAAIWEDEKQRHREIFNNSKITPPVSQDRSDVRKTTSEEYFLGIFQSKMKSIALSQESKEDDSFNQSHCELNKSGVENFEFLEMFKNILEAEEADSILSTQISDKNSQILKIDDHGVSGDESDDSLEMSQVFWLEDLVPDEVDEDLEKHPHSSGSSFIQLGQKEAIRVDSRLSNSDHIYDEAGCSFWLPQLDGAFDSTDDGGSAESSSLLELAKRRKPPRKYKSLSTSSKRLSRTKALRTDKRPTNEETNSVKDVGTSNRILRKRNDKPYQCLNKDISYFNTIDQILEELPPSATNAILTNNVKIPLYVNLKHLKKLGTEKVVVGKTLDGIIPLKNEQLQDAQKIVGENILAIEESDRKEKGSSRFDEGEAKPVKRACRRGDTNICITPIRSSNLRLRSRSQLIREKPLLEISKLDKVSENKSDGGSLSDDSFKKNDNIFNLNLETQIVNESGEDLFPNNALTKLSPKSQKENILLTPPFTNSPTEPIDEFVSFRSRSCSVSSASENDITLCLESSDESFHSDQELTQTTRNLLNFDPDEPCKLNSSSYESNSESPVVNDDNSTQRTTTLVYSLENQSKPSQQTKLDSVDSAVQMQAEDIDVIKENQVDLETRKCNLNSSVYSFVNLDASMSSLEEITSPNDNGKADFIQEEATVEYEILQAPLPPPRYKVEIGGFDILKLPDSTSKIDKQGYSLDPNHLEEYQGTFRGALDKIKNLSNANPPVNLCENEDIITPLIIPPSFNEVENWCQQLSKPLIDIEKNLKEVIELTDVSKTPISSAKTETFVTSLLEPSTPCLTKKTSTQERKKKLRKNNKFKFRNILDDEKESLSPIFFDSDKSSLETILEEPVETKTETTFSNEKLKPKKVLKITPTRNNDTFSVIEGVTQNSSSEFPSMHEKFDQRKTHMEFITVMSLEVHCQTRDSFKPDPKLDEITAVFYCIQNQSPPSPSVPEIIVGAIVVEKLDLKPPCSDGNEGSSKSIFSENSKSSNFKMEIKYGTRDLRLFGCDCLPNNTLNVTTVASEKDLYEELVNLMKKWDPEIIIGYEVEMLSWGYVLERASEVGEEFCGALSRIPKSRGVGATRSKSRMSILVEDLDSDNIPDIKVTGRIVLNVWKIMRKEVALTSYTFENAYYHISNKRVPYYDSKTLTEWFCNSKLRWNLLEHYVYRVCGVIELMDHFNIVGRTSELARIFGIQFFEVFSRGSQFRVESMMLRMVKAANFIAVSPSIQQRAHSRAPESLPLILEPESKFYTDPVLVLDFQSLYPSIIIAYNYCYSTCLGRVEYLGLNDPFEFGCTSLSIPLEVQKKLQKDVTICPLGIVFVKPKIRRGILPKMLQEILETRIMVKKSMKENKGNKSVVKLLDARQLGLKLIANVTFGYTAANYSGRMPCVEVADSILSKSRETLQNAITFVENNSKWGAHVVYGDTDSMFVRLPGRTKEQAFKIGEEIAEAVTALNPNPIKLKFEKVYLPCVLQTKKRYVGYMYETVDQKEPVFDAKGIETVRRDSCPAVGKILEKSLRLLFSNRDLYPVKMYIQRQFQKLLSDRTNIQDLIFAKEFRGINGYRAGAHYVPALTIARRMVHLDPRAEPRVGERVPYVIVYGEPGLPLIKLVRQPQELLNDDSLRINSQYYITRVIIPPLERVFCLLGFTVSNWLNELPRTLFTNVNKDFGALVTNKTSLPQYFTRVNCVICERPSDKGFCLSCKNDSQRAVVLLEARMNDWETSLLQLTQICQSCTGLSSPGNYCQSLDCPVLFRLAQAKKDITQQPFLREKIDICLNDSCTI